MSTSSTTEPDPAHEHQGAGRPPALLPGLGAALRRRLALLNAEPEAGMSTAEYAVRTVLKKPWSEG